jgi:CDP-glycerol glycerophosphotransferase
VAPDRAVLVGYPKLDDLLNGRWRAADVRRALGLDPLLPTLLFAPTFSVAGSLHSAGRDIVRIALESGANVIVKLHDRSMTADAHHTGGIDWPVELATFTSNPRFALARGADVAPLLAAADTLITDHSTVGFEFALLDRPIVVYDAPALLAAARIDAAKWKLLRSMAEVVRTPSELASAIATAFAHPELRSGERRQARSLFAWPGHSTERAVAVVYELLELTPPSTSPRLLSREHDFRTH